MKNVAPELLYFTGEIKSEIVKYRAGNKIDDFLRNAIDTHCHSYPEISLDLQMSVEDSEAVRIAQGMGVRGMVIKSHFWPTIGKVYELQRLAPDMKLFSSVTLNPCVGGMEPWVIEAAAKQGASIIWMPTWSTVEAVAAGWKPHHWKKELPTLEKYFTSEKGIEIIDSRGKLTPKTVEVIRLVKEFDLALSTGHLSIRESQAVAEECQRINLHKLVFGHPLSTKVPPLEDLKALVSFGGFIEVCALSTITTTNITRLHPDHIVEVMDAIGYQHFILSSDGFTAGTPPAPEMLRMLIGMLVIREVPDSAIRTMVQENPAKLLGLDWESSSNGEGRHNET